MNKNHRILAASLAFAVMVSAVPVQAAQNTPSAYMNTLSQVAEKYPSTRNQGDYATCWAFAAVSLAEMDLIADNQISDKNIDLSELALAYDTCHPSWDAFGGTAGDGLSTMTDYLDVGGNLNYCSRTLLQWRGLVLEESAPYSLADSYQGQGTSQAAHLQNISILDIHKNRNQVKQEIMEHGAAGIGFYFSMGGEFDQRAIYQGRTVATYYCDRSGYLYVPNHAAVIVGWDDDFPADNFKNKPKENGAWLVRNSWSETTADDLYSYFWLSYEDKSLESNAWIMDFEPADNYDYIYQYDGCPIVGKLFNCPVSANVYKVQGADSQLLRAVSITLNEDTSVPYTIKIYSNLSNLSNPRSGILETAVSGQTTCAGTYTIPLKQPVSLDKGSRYGIVVELGKKNAGVDMELAIRQYPIKSTAGIKKKQSFLYQNGVWKDVAVSYQNQKVGNLCIKGYTDQTNSGVGTVAKIKTAAVSTTSVKIAWTSAPGAWGYELYRSDSKNGTYRKIATVTGKSYKDTGLKKGKTYYYKVRACQKSNGVKITGKPSAAVKASGKRG